MAKDKNIACESKLEAQLCLILMKAGVTGPDIDACLTWAFGKNALYVPIYPDWIDRWHKLHPQHSVKKDMPFVNWLYTIGYLYTLYIYKGMPEKEVRKIFSVN